MVNAGARVNFRVILRVTVNAKAMFKVWFRSGAKARASVSVRLGLGLGLWLG